MMADADEADGRSYYDAEIDGLALQSLAVYQKQHELVDRIWAYFNQYSGLMILLGLGVILLRDQPAVNKLHLGFALAPAFAYAVFFMGNHIA
ncbi:MAG TPA: hypothetical protein VNB23_05475, partial [Ramlibacter sp.]|nr:hypothetical protein [Ramlibacter sp.]